MKAQLGDYIKTSHMDRPLKVIGKENPVGRGERWLCYVLETGELIADVELTLDDVLLESEVA